MMLAHPAARFDTVGHSSRGSEQVLTASAAGFAFTIVFDRLWIPFCCSGFISRYSIFHSFFSRENDNPEKAD
jgi:hypothetical protein